MNLPHRLSYLIESMCYPSSILKSLVRWQFFLAVLTVVSGIAGAVFLVDRCSLSDAGNKGVGATVSSPAPRPTASPTPLPPPTPTSVSLLDKQLKEALSVSSSSSKGTALLVVAQHAVLVRDYVTAIKAAAATPYNYDQARHLAFVVRCAIEDELYDAAAEAANRVTYTSDRDKMKIEVIEARKRAYSTSEPALSDAYRIGRVHMACFGKAK